jgi:hypothetical protein
MLKYIVFHHPCVERMDPAARDRALVFMAKSGPWLEAMEFIAELARRGLRVECFDSVTDARAKGLSTIPAVVACEEDDTFLVHEVREPGDLAFSTLDPGGALHPDTVKPKLRAIRVQRAEVERDCGAAAKWIEQFSKRLQANEVPTAPEACMLMLHTLTLANGQRPRFTAEDYARLGTTPDPVTVFEPAPDPEPTPDSEPAAPADAEAPADGEPQ